MQPVRTHHSTVTHLGRPGGRYQSGRVRWNPACASASRRSLGDASPMALGTPITCKRCLAKLAAKGAPTTPES
jgi:hypothetical protein